MQIKPITNSNPIRKHLGKIIGIPLAAAMLTGAAVNTVKNVNRLESHQNKYDADNGNLFTLMHDSKGFDKGYYGQAFVNMNNQKTINPPLEFKKEISSNNYPYLAVVIVHNANHSPSYINGFKFSQKIGDETLTGEFKTPSTYVQQISTIDKASGEINFKDLSYNVKMQKNDDGSWSVSAKNDNDSRDYKALIERNDKTGNAEFNLYNSEKKLVYSQPMNTKIASDEDYIGPEKLNKDKILGSILMVLIATLCSGSIMGGIIFDVNQDQKDLEKENDSKNPLIHSALR